MLLHRAVEADDAVLRDGGFFAVDIRDFAVSLLISGIHQQLESADVVRQHARAVVEAVVDGDDGQIAVHQLNDLRRVEIGADDAHTVYIAVSAVLQIGHARPPDVVVDEGDVVPALLPRRLERIQHGGEEAVRQTRAALFLEQNAQVVGAVGCERAGDGVGVIADFTRRALHEFAGFEADVRVVVERLADSGDGQAALCGNILDGHGHGRPSFRLCWKRRGGLAFCFRDM